MHEVRRPSAAPHVRRRPFVDPVHLLLRAVCGAAAIGAAIAFYARLLALIDDPMPAAIVTLIAAMLILVVASRSGRRP